MKPMNKRTLTLMTIAIMEFLVIVVDIALFVMGKISVATFWTVMIILGLASAPLFYFAARGITAGIKSPQEQAADEVDGFNLDELILSRTPESTIIEIVSLVILIAAWCVVGRNHFLHDDISFMVGVTVSVIFLLGDAYLPAHTVIYGKRHNLRQATVSARLKRVMAVLFSMSSLLNVLKWLHMPVLEYVCVAVLVLTYIVFRYVMHRAR